MMLDVHSSINSTDNTEEKKNTYLVSNLPGTILLYCRRTEEVNPTQQFVLYSFWHKLH